MKQLDIFDKTEIKLITKAVLMSVPIIGKLLYYFVGKKLSPSRIAYLYNTYAPKSVNKTEQPIEKKLSNSEKVLPNTWDTSFNIEKHYPEVLKIALSAGYIFSGHLASDGAVAFKKDGVRINIWLTKMTVGVYFPASSPKKIKQVFRKNVTLVHLKEIFKNPNLINQ